MLRGNSAKSHSNIQRFLNYTKKHIALNSKRGGDRQSPPRR